MGRRVAVASILWSGILAFGAAQGAVIVGQPVPDLSVTTLDGNKLGLHSFKGKRVLVFMWASW